MWPVTDGRGIRAYSYMDYRDSSDLVNVRRSVIQERFYFTRKKCVERLICFLVQNTGTTTAIFPTIPGQISDLANACASQVLRFRYSQTCLALVIKEARLFSCSGSSKACFLIRPLHQGSAGKQTADQHSH